ncbi:hypothetical protein [Aestuariicoccus sp. MJ-SS9]|uniref:hypothetical protein n=1 Tax=Aestuariicoccus sp. MJ-SS9 TaxID=3079855 RepID=UPI002907E017|nr:hypothetical protein [Aestuariicoccus sp. MJ-SS9]MDU8911485.1 hypothetical protein [Aestuariicoccus sp. MJ-SS9]
MPQTSRLRTLIQRCQTAIGSAAHDITREVTVNLGCEPSVTVIISEVADGTLIIRLEDIDGVAPSDLDGFFFDLADEALLDADLTVFPFVNTGDITGFGSGDDDQTTLSNGAMVAEGYDVSLQFGTVPDSTEGSVEGLGFTLYSDSGVPLTLEDIDLEKLAVVVDSDGGEGKVLLPHDGAAVAEDGTDPGPEDDGLCEITMTDPKSGLEVTVTLTELADGDMQVDIAMPDGSDAVIGDLRGFFFNIEDQSKLDDMTATGADVTDSQFAADDVKDVGNGANIKGEIVNEYGAFDGGIEIGTQGASEDDIQSTSFILSHPDGLSLDDFDGQAFALRLTSVGTDDDGREGSLKLVGFCEPKPPVECEDEYDAFYTSVMAAAPAEEEPVAEEPAEDLELDLV